MIEALSYKASDRRLPSGSRDLFYLPAVDWSAGTEPSENLGPACIHGSTVLRHCVGAGHIAGSRLRSGDNDEFARFFTRFSTLGCPVRAPSSLAPSRQRGLAPPSFSREIARAS